MSVPILFKVKNAPLRKPFRFTFFPRDVYHLTSSDSLDCVGNSPGQLLSSYFSVVFFFLYSPSFCLIPPDTPRILYSPRNNGLADMALTLPSPRSAIDRYPRPFSALHPLYRPLPRPLPPSYLILKSFYQGVLRSQVFGPSSLDLSRTLPPLPASAFSPPVLGWFIPALKSSDPPPSPNQAPSSFFHAFLVWTP